MMEGGVPLLEQGRVVGAIGVSGVLPQQDQQVIAAISSESRKPSFRLST